MDRIVIPDAPNMLPRMNQRTARSMASIFWRKPSLYMLGGFRAIIITFVRVGSRLLVLRRSDVRCGPGVVLSHETSPRSIAGWVL